jgi:hypothetical protein
VKKEILQNNYDNGGLKIINLNAFILSLKSTWIRRLFQKDNKWQNIFMSFIDTDRFYNYGSDYIQKIQSKLKNTFWKDVLLSWAKVIEKERKFNCHFFLASPIWFNNKIKIDNKSIFYKEWFEKGVQSINDLINEDGTYLTLDQFQGKYKIVVNFFKYNSIISAIRQAKRSFTTGESRLVCPFIPSIVQQLLRQKKVPKICMISSINVQLHRLGKKYGVKF